MHVVRIYPLLPGTTVADVREGLAVYYVNMDKIILRSARTIHKRFVGLKQAFIYFDSEADASLFTGLFQNTTHHPFLLYRYTFLPTFAFGPWSFPGVLHARTIAPLHRARRHA